MTMDSFRDQRGVVLPSPVVLLSIVALVMAAVAFVATRGEADQKVEIPTVSISPSGSAKPTPAASATVTTKPAPKPKPVDRSKVKVVVFNNTSIKGLAATASAKVTKAGWTVVGADNWYGSIPKTTVYFPSGAKAEAKQLALDLGVKRVAKAQPPMSNSRITVILTGPLR